MAAIFPEGELALEAICKEFFQVRQEGKRQVRRELQHDNLAAVLAGARNDGQSWHVAGDGPVSATLCRFAPIYRYPIL